MLTLEDDTWKGKWRFRTEMGFVSEDSAEPSSAFVWDDSYSKQECTRNANHSGKHVLAAACLRLCIPGPQLGGGGGEDLQGADTLSACCGEN